MLFGFLVFIILIVSLLLVVSVMLQAGKGGGLAGMAAGSQATQILGARQAPDFLEKATWVLSTALIVLCLLTSLVTNRGEATRSIIQEQGGSAPAQSAPVAPVTPVQPPAQPPVQPNTPPANGQ